ncbi:MAG: hypothetical protein L3J28_08000 [Candidatus Polarisedimenticolaceae bacterium]|nr:hypothetical protein [Candidatus Polarisedimenticolaceae bacterium]
MSHSDYLVVNEGRSFRPVLIFLLILSTSLLLKPSLLQAGTACVIAKELGNSLAIEWVASYSETADSALEKAKYRLKQAGYKRQKMLDVHAQNSSDLEHGFVLILRAEYTNWRGKPRVSYGCGFSPISSKDAGQAALDNLRSYAWGWKAEDGYEVIEERQF